RAADPATLVAGSTRIELWGVERIAGLSAPLQAKARVALDTVIGPQKVQCSVKSRQGEAVTAQCLSADQQDLALSMLQQGYVSADRAAVYGSPFEEPYLNAEAYAREQKTGIWGVDDALKDVDSRQEGVWLIMVGFVLFVFIVGAFVFLSITIMRGFQKVIDAQQANMDMMGRERKLKDKERGIVANMLDSEIKANKSKIEAYLMVYEEMLANLKDPSRTPKYKKAGDIVQEQPALDRSVFDRNTDKLDVLGDRLSSEAIHFYARIKTKPEYLNLEPDTPLDEAMRLVETCLKKAKRMDGLAARLIQAFQEGGLQSGGYEDTDLE
ncbi:MAG: thermonuclease family protein, partial [Bdellovibrionales bacterium]